MAAVARKGATPLGIWCYFVNRDMKKRLDLLLHIQTANDEMIGPSVNLFSKVCIRFCNGDPAFLDFVLFPLHESLLEAGSAAHFWLHVLCNKQANHEHERYRIEPCQ